MRKEQIEKVVNLTKFSGSEVIKLKGSTVYAPGEVIRIMADAVIRDRKRVMSVSTILQGEYGFSGVSIGVPCILGKNGVEKILELRLDAKAREDFENSAKITKDAIGTIPQD
jgi:malate dehydrogenase